MNVVPIDTRLPHTPALARRVSIGSMASICRRASIICRRESICFAAIAISICWHQAGIAQTSSNLAPAFRPRTDGMAVQDADKLREELKRTRDSRGPINPLGDYVKPRSGRTSTNAGLLKSTSASKEASKALSDDDEASQVPSLGAEAQSRLKANPPQVSSTDLSVVQLLPPSKIRDADGNPMSMAMVDDGFRPVNGPRATSGSLTTSPSVRTIISGPVVPATWETPVNAYSIPSSMVPNEIRAYQIDSEAMTQPTLGGLPSLPASPTYNPAPTYSAPTYAPAPTTGTLNSGITNPVLPPSASIPSAPSTIYGGVPTVPMGTVPYAGAPTPSVVPGAMLPSAPLGSIPAPTMPSTAAPVTVMPAPPTYFVPGPQGLVPGAMPSMNPGATYAPNTMPSYSKSGTFVNSAPFVSKAPEAIDARWMVSPAVYSQAYGANSNCAPASATAMPGSTVPGMGTGAVGSGVYGAPAGMVPNTAMPTGVFPGSAVAPTMSPTPIATASPFTYTPPAAMPPQTVYAASNGGYTPVVGFGQGTNAQLGRGLYGQPTAYVDGQPVRNFLRYVFP
jgi:hypothetical protein